MAPRNKRSKGLTRMDAALDAMRPMGFKDSSERKCVKDLLKVYGGNDCWKFIEDSAYKVLIDTILEMPEEPPRLEHLPDPLLEGNVDDSHKLLGHETEPCREVIVGVEEAPPINCSSVQALLEEIDAIEEDEQGQKLEGVDDSHKLLGSEPELCSEVIVGVEEAPPVNCSSVKVLLEEIDAIEEEEQGQKLEAVVPSKLLEDDVSIGFAPTCTPQARDIAPRNKKPCYGWISDDE